MRKSLYKCDECLKEDAVVKDKGIFWCAACWLKDEKEKSHDEDRRQYKEIPEDSGAYAKRRATKMCGEV